MRTLVKPSNNLAFADWLCLNFEQAAKLLGPNGKKLIQKGSAREIRLREDLYLGGDLLRVSFPSPEGGIDAIATLTRSSDVPQRLRWNCDRCYTAWEHVGALFSFVLEKKTGLRLAAPPPERQSADELSEEAIVERALTGRRECARTERTKVQSHDASTPSAEHLVTSLVSGKAYRVAFHGLESGRSCGSCPDFNRNTLAACQHLMKVASIVPRKFAPQKLRRPVPSERVEVFLRYATDIGLRVGLPRKLPTEQVEIIQPLPDGPIDSHRDRLGRLKKLETAGGHYQIFPDAARRAWWSAAQRA